MISVLDNLMYLLLFPRNPVCNVARDFWTGNSITNSNAKAIVEKSVVDDHLDTGEYLLDRTAKLCRTKGFLINDSKQDFTIIRHHPVIEYRI